MATNDDLKKLLLDIKGDLRDTKETLSTDIANLKKANEKLFSRLEDCLEKYRILKKENQDLKKRLDQADSAIQISKKRTGKETSSCLVSRKLKTRTYLTK